jgi:hypothetical protein
MIAISCLYQSWFPPPNGPSNLIFGTKQSTGEGVKGAVQLLGSK